MLGDRIRVKYLVGSRLEEAVIDVRSAGGTIDVRTSAGSDQVPSGMVGVFVLGQRGDVRERALFSLAATVVMVEERRHR